MTTTTSTRFWWTVDKLRELHCVQLWSDDVWRTVYVSSFYGDAAEVFQNELHEWDGPKRFVTFSVEGVDFIATQAKGYALVRRTG